MAELVQPVPNEYPKWVRVKGKAEGSEGYKQLVRSKLEENALLGLKNCEPEQAEPHAAPEIEETAEEGDADATGKMTFKERSHTWEPAAKRPKREK